VTICYAIGVNDTSTGEGVLNFLSHAAVDWISTAQVLALIGSIKGGSSKSQSSSANTGTTYKPRSSMKVHAESLDETSSEA
jgi:hypothetical protein